MNPGSISAPDKPSNPQPQESATEGLDGTVGNAVSIVMVTYFTGPVLFEVIEAVLSEDGLRELILVNNGNPPEVVTQIERRAAKDDRLIWLSEHGNIGFAAGCNLGAKSARGEYLLLLNPDSILAPGGLRNLLAEGIRRPRPWMLGGRLMSPDGTEQRGSRREILTPWIAFVEIFHLSRLAPNHPYFKRLNLHTSLVPRQTTAVPVISGACMMLPQEDYWALGGMDEAYFLHVEDIDFCLRFRRGGGEIFFVPHVAVLHLGSTSIISPFFIEWHKTRGFIRYFRKNFSGIYPPLFLPLVNVGILARFAWKVGSLLARGLFGDLARKKRNHRLPFRG